MILSNEPGYYKKGSFGIRIENLVFVKKIEKKIFFENLTLVPIEKKLINYNLLNKLEKNYKTISLGQNGNGPLLEYASLREYGKYLKPKILKSKDNLYNLAVIFKY